MRDNLGYRINIAGFENVSGPLKRLLGISRDLTSSFKQTQQQRRALDSALKQIDGFERNKRALTENQRPKPSNQALFVAFLMELAICSSAFLSSSLEHS